MKTTLLILSLFILLGVKAARAEEPDSSPETIQSVTDSSLGIRTDFVTTKDDRSYTCITVPGSAGWSQTTCFD